MAPVHVQAYFPLLTGTPGKIIPQKVLKKIKKGSNQQSSRSVNTQKADDILGQEAAGDHLLEDRTLNSSV